VITENVVTLQYRKYYEEKPHAVTRNCMSLRFSTTNINFNKVMYKPTVNKLVNG